MTAVTEAQREYPRERKAQANEAHEAHEAAAGQTRAAYKGRAAAAGRVLDSVRRAASIEEPMTWL